MWPRLALLRVLRRAPLSLAPATRLFSAAAAAAAAPPPGPPVPPAADAVQIDAAARAVFGAAWQKLEASTSGGVDAAAFPRELIWLTGAPGAGKGTHIATILKERDLQHTVEVSSLLTGPAFEAVKASGRLVSDSDVVHAVLRALLEPRFAAGVVLDGFPRTAAQAAAIVLLAERLEERCVRFAAHPSAELRARTRKPRFTLATLWCDEEVSVKRQMSRGAGLARAHSIAASVGISDASTPMARSTDLDEARARARYAAFRAEVAACLAITRGHVRAVFIDASDAAEEVAGRVRKAFSYTAALDLDPGVYDLLRPIKSASSLVKCARSALVARLGRYGQDSPELLSRVVGVLQAEFMHILEQQALMGAAVVRSQNALLLGDRSALVIALDVLAERGYHVVLDVQLTHIPVFVTAGAITCKTQKVLQFSVTWARPEVRDGGE
jgi:adenylate kinase